MTSKSIGLSNCFCFKVGVTQSFTARRLSDCRLFSLGAQNTHQMFHITGVKILLFFCLFFFPFFLFFTSPCIHGNLIFHISFWFADVIAKDAGSHATDRPVSLISLTTTNHKWRTNERNIDRFHGNWQDGLNFPIPMCKWSTNAY